MKFYRWITAALSLAIATGTYAASPITVSESAPTVTQNFNSASGKAIPEGWAIDVNRDKTRTIRTWNDAQTETDNDNAGPNLASNQKNGSYFFYDSSNVSDLALGGITTGTGTANGADCITVMTAITNDATNPIDRVNISYSIEKYRYGNNASGWEVSLYYSSDGTNWTSAGDNFKKLYAADSQTIGAEIVPILTDKVENQTLMVDVAPSATLYLGWMISVASGDQGSGAQAFAIDDVEITAGYASADARYIYIENATRLNTLSIFAPDHSDYYGAKPGATSTLTKNVNGVVYSVWEAKGTSSYTIEIANGETNIGTANVPATGDIYLCASPEGVEPITDPESYTGWVDPDRPPFTASGIYIRGEVNSWGSLAEWEFSKESDTTYVLYDKTLSGQFKVADANWSASCNYGSNGTNVMADEPYALVSGTDTNISCGNYTFACSRIILTIAEGKATLLLEGDDSEAGLTSVYMVGDFNNWNYSGTGGELQLNPADGLFKGRVSMKAGPSGSSEWLIYLRPGRIGSYGAQSSESSTALEGILVKGSSYRLSAPAGTYDAEFNLSTGAYRLTAVESAPTTFILEPAYTVLVPENPETVKVLSLNNSLIHYNDQARMFNEIAESMGKDATWTKHTNLGKTLQYHWEEGEGLTPDGMPGAKMTVRSEAWSHIILQEQTALPRTGYESFRQSVKLWVDYIRENCPNPNAVIILPINWHYAQDWSNFNENNSILIDNYTKLARELGVVVCPVATAYQAKFDTDGGEKTEKEWFLPGDDRHPTIRATYMAALMEYGLIFNEDPTYVDFFPEYTTEYDSQKIDATIASEMRRYASEALKNHVNTINHHAGTVAFSGALYDDFGIELKPESLTFSCDGGTIDVNGLFTATEKGRYTITAEADGFTQMATVVVTEAETEVPVYPSIEISADAPAVSQNFDILGENAEAVLPEGWRIDRQTSAPRTVGTFAGADESTMYVMTDENRILPSNAKNGTWNFGDSDRAIGGITTGVDGGSRAINVYTHLLNTGKKNFGSLDIAYNVEKYRKGSNAAGFAVQMYYSFDGKTWTSAGDDFRTYFEPDAATEGYAEVPGETKAVKANLPVIFGAGTDLYLAWNISVASGSDAQAAMALAIDDVEIEGLLPAVPEYKYHIYVDDRTSYDALGLYAWGTSELFGSWPGQAPIDEQEIEGTTYKVFGHDADTGSFSLIFNNWNQGKQLPDYNVSGGKDYYLRITDGEVTMLDISGITSLEEEDAATEYFTLSGMRVSFPEKGIYIVKKGTKTTKVVI